MITTIDHIIKDLEDGENEVIIYDKDKQYHEKKAIFRKYRSFGATPGFDPTHKKSYMFSGSKSIPNVQVPDSLLPFFKQIKSIDSKYNQFVVNYYKDGNDYIEPHSDCDKDMVDNYNILILSLGATRTMRFTGRKDVTGSFDLKLKDGQILILNKFLNKEFRHEILQDETEMPRISITARQMKVS